MAIIEPVRQDIEEPHEVKKNSSSLRLWHWSNALIISGSLITVLINSTVLDEDNNEAFLKQSLNNPAVTDQQTTHLAHSLSNQVWAVHIWFGYFLALLLVFRLILEAFQPRRQHFIGKLNKAWNEYFTVGRNRKLARHELAVKVLYAVFYFILGIVVLTGLALAFKKQLHLPRNIAHTIKDVHGFCMYLVIAFIVVHMVGVYLAERKDSAGIVSDMINGGRESLK